MNVIPFPDGFDQIRKAVQESLIEIGHAPDRAARAAQYAIERTLEDLGPEFKVPPATHDLTLRGSPDDVGRQVRELLDQQVDLALDLAFQRVVPALLRLHSQWFLHALDPSEKP